MEAYTSFAEVYDAFMDNIPYEEWGAYIIGLLREYHIEQGIVADLGCGTGIMTRYLKAAGYDMIGIDSSMEMLDVARGCEEDDSILYLMQDMREFELYGTVSAVISVCDCINYITEPAELSEVFRLVNNYLDPKGLFIFDFHPAHYYREILADNTFAEDRENMSFIWENEYDSDTRMNIYELSIFVKDDDKRYSKFQETHYQYGYTLSEMKQLIADSGLEPVAFYDAFTREAATEESERIYAIVRECGK